MDDPQTQQPISVNTWTGNALVFSRSPPPEIPDGKSRECPRCQCNTWADRRWCWNCYWDFDKATLPRVHTSKLLALSLALNMVLATLSLILVVTKFVP